MVKKSFFGTMLFPNFYVSSMRLALREISKRTRMSVTHSGWSKTEPRANSSHFYSALILRDLPTLPAGLCALPGVRSVPAVSSEKFLRNFSLQSGFNES
ncbi:MAG TPA: hypothetical protein VGR64_08530 [Terracidiphilus sp.]|nr:hypothetical protein [Terracidiphilus sp.]